MVLVAHLHGQLLAGRWGSYLVELAASWAIVLILTGLYLWWPRQAERFAGSSGYASEKAGASFGAICTP